MGHMLKNLKNNKVAIVGVCILSVFFFVAIFAPIIAPYNPHDIIAEPYLHPCHLYILGTNDVGQDIFSELIYGTRISLAVGVIAALSVTIIGTAIGIVSGYYKGIVDKFLTTLTNIAMTIPSLPLTILLVTFIKAGFQGIIISICITSWTGTARIIRSKVMQIRELPYIQIEKILGAKDLSIMFKHILPNVLDIVFTRCAMAVGSCMMMETSLSFLGLGFFGEKSWGNIMHFAFFRNGVINNYWWWYLPPIICISLCMLGFMLITYNEQSNSKLLSIK